MFQSAILTESEFFWEHLPHDYQINKPPLKSLIQNKSLRYINQWSTTRELGPTKGTWNDFK